MIQMDLFGENLKPWVELDTLSKPTNAQGARTTMEMICPRYPFPFSA